MITRGWTPETTDHVRDDPQLYDRRSSPFDFRCDLSVVLSLERIRFVAVAIVRGLT